MLFTTTALQHNIITQDEANLLEDWIDSNISDKVSQVPNELLPIFNKVSLFRAEGNLNG